MTTMLTIDGICIVAIIVCGIADNRKVCKENERLRKSLAQIADGLTTDLTSKHIARVALGWE